MDIVGKLCSFCDAIPSYTFTYPIKGGGISLVERYCSKCYDKREERDKEDEESKSYLETDADIINDIHMKDRVRELLS